MKLYLHPLEFTYKNASRHVSYVQQRSTKHTHTLSIGYCLGCQKHYVDGLARSLLVSPSGIFVRISGSLSMHWTCSRVLHLSDGQAREKSVWYILTAKTSSSFILTDRVKSFFPYFIKDNFSNATLHDVEYSLKMKNTIFKDVVLHYFMLPSCNWPGATQGNGIKWRPCNW